MTDYRNSTIGFTATLKEPLESQFYPQTEPLEEIMVMNHRGLRHHFTPLNSLAAALALTCSITAFMPEEVGQQIGHFANGFNTAAEGNPSCQTTINDSSILCYAGKTVGSIAHKLDEGFKTTNTPLPKV